MPLAEANQSFIPVIHLDAITEANQSFVPVIYSDAISRN
jgi:hypothetical protein